MEFGKLPYDQLDLVEWSLPDDDPRTARFLKSLRAGPNPSRYYLGAPAWAHREWIGTIYPAAVKADEYLWHYAKVFNTIELNTSHYRIPTQEKTQEWLAQVSSDFKFCPKVLQAISHSRGGLLDKNLLKQWYVFLSNLKANCGPAFLQLPPHFDYSDRAVLFNFLKEWPSEFRLALEFRHPSWFNEHTILPALVDYLQSRSIGLVITDVAGRRDVLHTSVSAPFTMIRFIGNGLHSSDFTRAREWDQRLRQWSATGLKEAFFFVHQPDDLKTPQMAQAVIEIFNSGRSGNVLKPVEWVTQQNDSQLEFL